MAFTWESNISGISRTESFSEIRDNVDYVHDNLACISHHGNHCSDEDGTVYDGHHDTYDSGYDGGYDSGDNYNYDSGDNYNHDGSYNSSVYSTRHGSEDESDNTGYYSSYDSGDNVDHYDTYKGNNDSTRYSILYSEIRNDLNADRCDEYRPGNYCSGHWQSDLHSVDYMYDSVVYTDFGD